MLSDKLDEKIKEAEKIISQIEDLKKEKKNAAGEFNKLNKDFNKGKISKDEYQEKYGKEGKWAKENEKYNQKIRELLNKLKEINQEISGLFVIKEEIKKTFDVDIKEIKTFANKIKKKEIKVEKEKYSTYSYNYLGKYANQWFNNLSKYLMKTYPEYFTILYQNLRLANIRVFSNTYINLGLLGSFSALVLSFISGFFLFQGITVLNILKIIVLSLFVFLLTLGIFFYYPKIIVDTRRREIKNDLPFAILHMAAVAGSGAKLIDIFGMLLQSGEYKSLSGEVKRIMNYTHLFGYNLTTALKSVAQTTPSDEFRDLLNGINGVIESGGSIKSFLKSKSEDTLIKYRLERQKYVETLGTYSDIYTALLIAAPLLFVVVLALISIVGSSLGGLEITFIEKLGTFVVVPALNIGFIVFMNIVQPEI